MSLEAPERPWTPAQAADYLQVKEKFLADLRSKGGGPPFVKFGKFVRYSKADLDAYLAQNRFTRTDTKAPAPTPN